MAKQLGPKCKLSRKAGTDLAHKSNQRSIETKCNLETPPGEHGKNRGKMSDYGLQLQMKQMIRNYYNMLEHQFRRFYEIAERTKGSTGANLLRMLESRLDNVVYHMGFASTRAEARQLVNHRAIMVDNVTVDVPSFQVKPGNEVAVRNKAKNQERIKQAIQLSQQATQTVDWVEVDYSEVKGIYNRYPQTEELPSEFKVNMVVELYSK